MIDVQIHRDSLDDRMTVIRRLIDETHPQGNPTSISRETRGLAIVLLFAAYEELLKSLTSTVLNGAIKLRVSNRRLKPGFLTFAIGDTIKSARDVSPKKLYSRALPDIVEITNRGGRGGCTINPDAFPDDGSFMKASQIELWCRVFDLGHPGAILRRRWNAVDTVVAERNGIAHGRLKPQDVGMRYTEAEIRSLIDDWHADWLDFLTHVEAMSSSRDFFRLPR